MKTIFEEASRKEIIERIARVEADKTAHWGKMNVYQMLRHCTLYEEWVQGIHRPAYRQAFMGRIFGKTVLREMMKENEPLRKNMSTLKNLLVTIESCDLEEEKARWSALIRDYGQYTNPGFIHTFLGKMSTDQIGQLVYKHADHHLRQFAC
ncbi:MAG: DUF1569 domain-containing protein [Mucilaginibacter polytrichastri]|nr:DUF1569 domain-containing protein [Mucilaginibacter polytrichastri]